MSCCHQKYLLYISTLLIVFAGPLTVSGQFANVNRISAQTGDGIIFTIWPKQATVRAKQDIIIEFMVLNRSKRTVYLVLEDNPEISIDRHSIQIGSPYPFPIEHGGYDYKFVKIPRGKSYQGQLTILGSKYPINKLAETEFWRIQVGYGYVTDITGLNRRLQLDEDPVVLRGPLSSRIKTLYLSSLTVRTVNP